MWEGERWKLKYMGEGRPKRRWLDKVKDDIKEKGMSADEVYDHATPAPHKSGAR